MSIELQYLVFAVFLLLIQMVLQALAGLMENGFMGLAGSRDDETLATGIGGRFERAYYNMLETFPVFAALVLIVQLTEGWTTVSALAVQIYFWGRVAYIPAYVIGLPFIRTAIWGVSMAGVLMLAWPLLQQVT